MIDIDIKPLKNVVNNAFIWSFADLGVKLGFDPPPVNARDEGYGRVKRAWDSMQSIADGVRNLDQQTLEILCQEREPEVEAIRETADYLPEGHR